MRNMRTIFPVLGLIFMAAPALSVDDPDHSEAAKQVNQTGKETLNTIGSTEEDMMKNGGNTNSSISPEDVGEAGKSAVKSTGDFIEGLR